MAIIPTEARATMAIYHSGRSQEEFLCDMWERREKENPPGHKVSIGVWPVTIYEDRAKKEASMNSHKFEEIADMGVKAQLIKK